ncbi:3-hydroxyacyl-[acyl-carrier-protein] dehydratase FabZ [Vitis vinifera]|nr:3-hydroxyacyl-[acyl-carrier-protein] dehydratase FabZ [Vitis vinifera]RVX23607.1 3-hydroxyacyl-[acyl-carrier-protein] dehydratase FabZ [Vitis vinifera]
MATISNSLFSPLTSPSPLSPRRPSTFTVSLSAPRFLSLQSNPRSTFIACASLDAGKGDVPVEKTYSAFPTVMDINQIREILPHRFPFLLVDRVIEYNPGISAIAIKNVTITITSFLGTSLRGQLCLVCSWLR